MLRKLSLAAAAACCAVLVGCSGGEESPAAAPGGQASASSTADSSGDVKITRSGVEDHEVWGPGAYVVRYEITNRGDEAADYFAQLEFLDADGDVLGTTGVTADRLGPGKTHRGDIAPLETEISNGKPGDIVKARVSQVDRT